MFTTDNIIESDEFNCDKFHPNYSITSEKGIVNDHSLTQIEFLWKKAFDVQYYIMLNQVCIP